MEFEAVILMALVFGATSQVLSNLPANLADNRLVKVLVADVVGIAALFLVGATVWANTQMVGGVQLDQLGVWDKVVAGLLIGFGASVTHEVLKTGANIGQNQPKTVNFNAFDKSKSAQHPYPLPDEYANQG